MEADEARFLDDIVIMGSDGRLAVKQVNFNPKARKVPFTVHLGEAARRTEEQIGSQKPSVKQNWRIR